MTIRYKEMPKRKRTSAGRTRMLAPLPGGVQARALAKVGSSDVARLFLGNPAVRAILRAIPPSLWVNPEAAQARMDYAPNL